MNNNNSNIAKGIIYGLAIGDAMGKPTEFISLSEIKEQYGTSGIQDLPFHAFYTDDTQMSLALARALLDSSEKDINDIMESVKTEFIKWKHSPEFYSGAPGHTCITGVVNMQNGVHWKESGVSKSKGCGSAMRVASIGYLYQNDPEKLKEVAHYSGICTHGHPTGDAACIGAAYLVKLILDGVNLNTIISELLIFTKGISQEFDDAILKVNKCLDWDDEEKALEYLGQGWIGEEAVALALYCFLRYPNSYEKTVLRGANTNGDSDSIACIAGGISGAYLGYEAIPDSWLKKIQNSSYLEEISNGLTDKKLFFHIDCT